MTSSGSDSDLLAVITAATLAAARGESLPTSTAQRLAKSICRRVCCEFGASRVYVPALDHQARDLAILAGLACGDTQSEIAARVGIHPSTVGRVAKRHRRQGDGLGPSGWGL